LTEPFQFHEKFVSIFFSKTCQNIKKEGQGVMFFKDKSGKKIDPRQPNFFRQKNNKKQKKLLQSYTPCLNSQSVKIAV